MGCLVCASLTQCLSNAHSFACAGDTEGGLYQGCSNGGVYVVNVVVIMVVVLIVVMLVVVVMVMVIMVVMVMVVIVVTLSKLANNRGALSVC